MWIFFLNARKKNLNCCKIQIRKSNQSFFSSSQHSWNGRIVNCRLIGKFWYLLILKIRRLKTAKYVVDSLKYVLQTCRQSDWFIHWCLNLQLNGPCINLDSSSSQINVLELSIYINKGQLILRDLFGFSNSSENEQKISAPVA